MKTTLTTSLFLAFLLGVGCNGTSFDGSGTKHTGAKDAGTDYPAQGDKDVDDANDANDGPDAGNDGGEGDDQGQADAGSDVAGKDGDTGEASDKGECFATKAGNYNFVLVFDASQSQATSDPTNLRVSGAKGFVERLGKLVEGHDDVTIKIASVAFASGAARGAKGWIDFKGKDSVSEVQGEIDDINATLNLGTNYVAALDEAKALLAEVDAKASDKKTRTFVIFMTDGEPNKLGSPISSIFGSLVDEINKKVDDLVESTGAAMIAVATGTEIKDTGETIVKGMAKPETGIVNPKHKGVYKRAATPEELKKLDTVLLDAVSDCE